MQALLNSYQSLQPLYELTAQLCSCTSALMLAKEALSKSFVFAQIPAVQLFLAVINVVLVLQRLPCANAQLACTPIILAFCLLALEVRSTPETIRILFRNTSCVGLYACEMML